MTDDISRRGFLATSAALAGTIALPGHGLAAQGGGGDYRALVAVMMRGGLDAHDCLIPTDPAGYGDWAKARAAILDGGAPNRDRASLLPLEGLGQSFGFAPELEALMPYFNDGRLAIVPNIGPLVEPTDARSLSGNRKRLLPPRIGSHNDQQSVWEGLSAEGARWGWGGRIIDAVAPNERFAAIPIDQNALFTYGRDSRPVVVGAGKVKPPLGASDKLYGSKVLPQLLREHLSSGAVGRTNILARDIAQFQQRALDDYMMLSELLKDDETGSNVRIEGNGLSQELSAVASLIANRGALGARRQVFFVQASGTFDTHARQMNILPGQQTQIATALARFQEALDTMGLGEQVTTFTMSDFGRTLVSNRSGTDHGWGGHSYVLGGAGRGGRAVGTIPPSATGHDHDYRRGSLIPQFAIEQMGADLARWMGVAEADLDAIFPQLGRFDRHGVSLFG
jgi:uncharacterized protein (DUF1501 family)